MKNKKYFFQFLIFVSTLILIMVPATNVTAQNNNPPEINEDKVVVGQIFTLLEDQVMSGDLAIIGGTAILKSGSILNGDIALLGGAIQIEGTVNGDIQGVGGSIDLKETAILNGDFYNFGSTLTRNEGAVITGNQIANVPFKFNKYLNSTPSLPRNFETGSSRFFNFVGDFLMAILQIISLSALALVLIMVIPNSTLRVARAIEKQPFVAWGIGLLTLFVFPLVLLVMVLTLILIPIAAISVLIFAVAIIFGWIGLGFLVGLKLFSSTSKGMSPALKAAFGTLIISTIGRIIAIVPCIGGLLVIFVGLTGLGAVILTYFGTRPYPLATIKSIPTPAYTREPEIGAILADIEDEDLDSEDDEIDLDPEDPSSPIGGNL